MSEAKFTKGPWEYDNRMIEVLADNGAEPVCFDVCSDENGHLIAAAPEMYEMLDALCTYLIDLDSLGTTHKARQIEKLLAKARGEA